MISLDIDLPEQLLPFAWISGVWKGFGVVYGEDSSPSDVIVEVVFKAESFNNSYVSKPFLTQVVNVYSVDVDSSQPVVKEMSGLVGYEKLVADSLLYSQTAYWFLGKEVKPSQPKTKACELSVVSTSSTGHAGSWYGLLDGPTVQIVTDAFLSCEGSEQYGGQKQMFGLVQGDLMMVSEVPDPERQLRPIFSARLGKVVE